MRLQNQARNTRESGKSSYCDRQMQSYLCMLYLSVSKKSARETETKKQTNRERAKERLGSSVLTKDTSDMDSGSQDLNHQPINHQSIDSLLYQLSHQSSFSRLDVKITVYQ